MVHTRMGLAGQDELIKEEKGVGSKPSPHAHTARARSPRSEKG